ncbi:MAG: SRPBCC family protein [Myxococcales bacterium]
MKKTLKYVGIGVAALVLVFVGVGSTLDGMWRVEKSVLVNAPPEHVHPLVDDLRAWQLWAAWNNAMDPEVKNTYSEPAAGVGAWWSWSGPKMGRGRMTIVRSEVGKGVWVDESIETDEVNAHGSLEWSREGEATKVVWRDEGKLPPIFGGYFKGFIEGMLGEHFQTGLDGLKREAEKRHAEAQEKPAEPAAEPAQADAAPAEQ